MVDTDGFVKQSRFASSLYLMSVMLWCYSVIIYCDISAHVHGKEVADGLNAIYKQFIYQLMSKVQVPG